MENYEVFQSVLLLSCLMFEVWLNEYADRSANKSTATYCSGRPVLKDFEQFK